MSNLVAIFGISGVGKTTACKSFIRRNPTFGYISASEVLRKAGGLSIEQLRRQSKQEILENQRLLADKLPDEISKIGAAYLLLDAQNVVDNGVELVEIPVAILETLAPCGIILLEADPADVYQRRKSDVRARPVRTPEEIAHQMSLIRLVTDSYAKKLGIPAVTGFVGPYFEIDDSIKELLSVSS